MLVLTDSSSTCRNLGRSSSGIKKTKIKRKTETRIKESLHKILPCYDLFTGIIKIYQKRDVNRRKEVKKESLKSQKIRTSTKFSKFLFQSIFSVPHEVKVQNKTKKIKK